MDFLTIDERFRFISAENDEASPLFY